MQAVLSIINEIYSIDGIKDNIKFEIENIFTKLGINDRHKLLKSHILENKKPIKNSMDFNTNNLNTFVPTNPTYHNSCSSINSGILSRNNSSTPANSSNKLLLNLNN